MFDKVLKPNVTQDQVYSSAAKNIVKGKADSLECIIMLMLLVLTLFHENFFAVLSAVDVRLSCNETRYFQSFIT